ncbi:unnamed protein product [Protopolystoma xenopodis]|uniref:Uncharacterized protein n=1 Tax=Protopolystoma xenopodis TaxID=117903 RepID=A0A448XB40_9PLAT|nr:unnamed protein product [Protopolystoma xenopodis]
MATLWCAGAVFLPTTLASLLRRERGERPERVDSLSGASPSIPGCGTGPVYNWRVCGAEKSGPICLASLQPSSTGSETDGGNRVERFQGPGNPVWRVEVGPTCPPGVRVRTPPSSGTGPLLTSGHRTVAVPERASPLSAALPTVQTQRNPSVQMCVRNGGVVYARA